MTEQIYDTLPDSFNTLVIREETKRFDIEDVEQINIDMKLNLDSKDIELYKAYFKKRNIQPTDIELFDLAQIFIMQKLHFLYAR